jgi:hypothetical protein
MKKEFTYILLCDTMQKKSNIKLRELYELTKMLEISSIDVEKIMIDCKSSNEQICLTDGPKPPMYKSALYGAISIYDF